MKKRSPTNCPVVFSLDIFGDKWSLVILRDVLFSNKYHFREFLASEEKIASNILSARLKTLIDEGLLVKEEDPSNKSAATYKPTQKALDLLPALVELMRWGITYNPNSDLTIPLMRQLIDNPESVRASVGQYGGSTRVN